MGAGFILEDHHLPRVPGTVILEEDVAHSEAITGSLKHGTGRYAHIVLTPQPSDDPNDPLNWSFGRKMTIMTIACMGTIIFAACLGQLLNASQVVVAQELNVTIAEITLSSGYQVLVVGGSAPFVSAISRRFGKRPLFVFSSFVATVGSLIGSLSQTYNQLLTARIIQGLAVSTYESLVTVMIGDLYFVHERGIYLSIISFLLSAVANVASVVCGPVTTKLGWKYLFYIITAMAMAQLIAQVLFVPETTYIRERKLEIDELPTDNIGRWSVDAPRSHSEKTHTEKSHIERTHPVENTITETSIPPRKTFVQNLKLYNGIFSRESFPALLIAPFGILLNVSVCYIVVLQAWFIGLYVSISFVIAQIFGLPPYNLNPTGIGMLSLGPFAGGMIAMILLVPLTDPLIMFMTKRNNGVYEPEYRLLISILGISSGVALFGFGIVVANFGTTLAAATLHGVVIFGVMALIVSTSTYALDAYRDMSNEIFIMGMMSKNFLLYGFTYFINNWYASAGPRHVFFVFGATGLVVMAGLPALYVFGKKYRSYWCRHNLLEKFHIRTHAE